MSAQGHSSAVSNLVAATLRARTGRGPRHTKTLVGDDTVVCVVRGWLSRHDERLVGGGHAALVERSRHALSSVVESELRSGVEALIDRRVEAVMNSYDAAADVSVHVFLLDGRPRG